MGRVVDQPLEQLPLALRDREQYWRGLLAECEASGEGITAFARRVEVAASSLFNWRTELTRRDRARRAASPAASEIAFLPVSIQEPDFADNGGARCPDASAEVILATGRRIRVGTNFDAGMIARLVRLLEDLTLLFQRVRPPPALGGITFCLLHF